LDTTKMKSRHLAINVMKNGNIFSEMVLIF
jgi:hypothetical protein